MFNVTVIFTRHDANGNCNSNELLKIVHSIQPEVIFEELLPSVYDQIYNQHTRTTLESYAVKLYSLTNFVEHIPVDTLDRPVHYHNAWNQLMEVIEGLLHSSSGLKTAYNNLMLHAKDDGFRFLNSDLNDVLIEEIAAQENLILAQIGDEKLDQIFQLNRDVHSKREDAIIDNIYTYAGKKTFETAILYIGAGHRKSIKAKIANQANREGVEIKWHFLDDLVPPTSQ